MLIAYHRAVQRDRLMITDRERRLVKANWLSTVPTLTVSLHQVLYAVTLGGYARWTTTYVTTPPNSSPISALPTNSMSSTNNYPLSFSRVLKCLAFRYVMLARKGPNIGRLGH